MFKKICGLCLIMLFGLSARAQDVGSGFAGVDTPTAATIDGRGPGWRALGEDDFINVNCDEDTWTWRNDSVSCTGRPVGVTRTKKVYTNFELVCEWRHLRDAGNSGIFLWSPIESLDRLEGPGLPEGIEAPVDRLGVEGLPHGGDEAHR